jgi:hypothetical protein
VYFNDTSPIMTFKDRNLLEMINDLLTNKNVFDEVMVPFFNTDNTTGCIL